MAGVKDGPVYLTFLVLLCWITIVQMIVIPVGLCCSAAIHRARAHPGSSSLETSQADWFGLVGTCALAALCGVLALVWLLGGDTLNSVRWGVTFYVLGTVASFAPMMCYPVLWRALLRRMLPFLATGRPLTQRALRGVRIMYAILVVLAIVAVISIQR
jgi:hypothetical protein